MTSEDQGMVGEGTIHNILQSYLQNHLDSPIDADQPPWQRLVADAQRYDQWCFATELERDGIERSLQQRLSLLSLSYPALRQFCCHQLGWPTVPLET
ncbi:MAG: hypothetical protein AB4042_06415, partial [Leptolyngbyaceae cyanobacterium]